MKWASRMGHKSGKMGHKSGNMWNTLIAIKKKLKVGFFLDTQTVSRYINTICAKNVTTKWLHWMSSQLLFVLLLQFCSDWRQVKASRLTEASQTSPTILNHEEARGLWVGTRESKNFFLSSLPGQKYRLNAFLYNSSSGSICKVWIFRDTCLSNSIVSHIKDFA